MTKEQKARRNEDSPEQKIKKHKKEKDPDPERQVDERKAGKESEKNPDDFFHK
ncbi:hypothetical protein [Alteribacillus sp. YIM 98480]|uniref:hypothetical protein n=1 Tax=Alteribacillus sp. YIM 98480 TaxID=2606599 RepID=UPI00131BF76D|nr:hypothetical protein [Alteribacillus sp. YIM 98480]